MSAPLALQLHDSCTTKPHNYRPHPTILPFASPSRYTGVLWHYGGKLQWGPDSHIYLTLGDKYRPDHAQRKDKYSSCILRIAKDGSIPAGNLPGHIKPKECWAYGLRNGFTSTWDLHPAGKERYLIAEVGGNKHSKSQEDIHLGKQGANYGWPHCEGRCSNPKFPSCSCDKHDDPIITWAHNNKQACIIGGMVNRGHKFHSKYYGVYFFGDFVTQSIDYLTFASDGSSTVTGKHSFHHASRKVQDLSMDSEGNLWYIGRQGWSNSAALFKISYSGDTANKPPQINSVVAHPLQGSPPLAVTFLGSASDVDSASISYTWDFGDGSKHATTAIAKHTYTTPGTYSARLFVTDGVREVLSNEVRVQVGTKPEITISSPVAASFFQSNDIIEFAGTAVDPKYGDLGALVQWRTDFIHNEHVHPYGQLVTGPSGSFTIPTKGHSFEGKTGFRITASVTNLAGTTSVAAVDIFPHKIKASVTSSPVDMHLYLDGELQMTPITLETVPGFQHTLGADKEVCGATTNHLRHLFVRYTGLPTQCHLLPNVHFHGYDIENPKAHLSATYSWQGCADACLTASRCTHFTLTAARKCFLKTAGGNTQTGSSSSSGYCGQSGAGSTSASLTLQGPATINAVYTTDGAPCTTTAPHIETLLLHLDAAAGVTVGGDGGILTWKVSSATHPGVFLPQHSASKIALVLPEQLHSRHAAVLQNGASLSSGWPLQLGLLYQASNGASIFLVVRINPANDAIVLQSGTCASNPQKPALVLECKHGQLQLTLQCGAAAATLAMEMPAVGRTWVSLGVTVDLDKGTILAYINSKLVGEAAASKHALVGVTQGTVIVGGGQGAFQVAEVLIYGHAMDAAAYASIDEHLFTKHFLHTKYTSQAMAAATSAACLDIANGEEGLLSCPEGRILGFEFASFGEPSGTCGSTSDNNSMQVNLAKHAVNSLPRVAMQCLGESSCHLKANDKAFQIAKTVTTKTAIRFELVDSGCCRTQNGGLGTYATSHVDDPVCKAVCQKDVTCLGYETNGGACELHTSAPHHGSNTHPSCKCYLKTTSTSEVQQGGSSQDSRLLVQAVCGKGGPVVQYVNFASTTTTTTTTIAAICRGGVLHNFAPPRGAIDQNDANTVPRAQLEQCAKECHSNGDCRAFRFKAGSRHTCIELGSGWKQNSAFAVKHGLCGESELKATAAAPPKCHTNVAHREASKSQMITLLPFFQMAPKSGFEICFARGIFGAGGKTSLECRIKKFKPRLIYACFSRPQTFAAPTVDGCARTWSSLRV